MTVGDKSLQPIYLFRAPYSFFEVVSVIIIKRVRHTSVKIQSLITIYNLHLLLLAHVLVRVSANDYDLAKLTLCCKFTNKICSLHKSFKKTHFSLEFQFVRR